MLCLYFWQTFCYKPSDHDLWPSLYKQAAVTSADERISLSVDNMFNWRQLDEVHTEAISFVFICIVSWTYFLWLDFWLTAGRIYMNLFIYCPVLEWGMWLLCSATFLMQTVYVRACVCIIEKLMKKSCLSWSVDVGTWCKARKGVFYEGGFKV
jgi:hypothetical protein